MEIKIPGDLSTASERGWRWRKICSPKNEMKNSCGEAVYHNAYFYFHWFVTSARMGTGFPRKDVWVIFFFLGGGGGAMDD